MTRTIAFFEHNAPATPNQASTETAAAGSSIAASLPSSGNGSVLFYWARPPATIYHIEVSDYGSGSPPTDYTVAAAVGNLLTPGSKHSSKAHLQDLPPNQLKAYEFGNGSVVEIHGTIHFGDMFIKKESH